MESKTKKEMDEVVAELKKFTSRVLEWNAPVDPALIGRFESRFGLKLPEDYKYLLGITNGFAVMGDEVLGMTDESYSYDLFKVYQFEHYEVIVPQYEYLIPFSPDGFGNFYFNSGSGFASRLTFLSAARQELARARQIPPQSPRVREPARRLL